MSLWTWLFGKRDVWEIQPFESADGPRWRIESPGNHEVIATSEAYSSAFKRDETMRKLSSVQLRVVKPL